LGLTVVSAWSYGRRPALTTTSTSAIDPCAAALAPAPGSSQDRAIVELQNEARLRADSRRALESLGYRYVARARVSSDPGDYTLAEQSAACLTSRYPDDAAAQLLRGHVLHQLHRFREAEEMARRLVARREFVLDYGLLGDALMDQGKLDEAAAAYQKMIDLKPFYQSYVRAAHLRWLKGDVENATALIRLAIQAASPRDRESVAWAYTRLAIYELQQGRVDEAAAAVDSALSYQPDYAAALLERGRVLVARDRPADAIAPLRRAAGLNPLPEFQWALADALRLTGQDREAERVERALVERGRYTDPRTLALFLATRRTSTADAVSVAEGELESRRDIFTLDALAWALAAAGRASEADAAMKRALAEGTEDGRLFLHAAVIAELQGRQLEASAFSTKATALRATLLPSERVELDLVRQRIAGRHH
jgi:tetratricopeptide (TPR) repeat protein